MEDNKFIEIRSLELVNELNEVLNDIQILERSIARAFADIPHVKTIEDAEEFDNTHDLEAGLKHIRLF